MNPQPTTGEILETLIDFRDMFFARFDKVDRKLEEILNRHKQRDDSTDARLSPVED